MTVVPPDAMVGGLPETGSSRRIRGAYHAFTVTARSPNELAVRAGVPAAFVERLVDLGIVAAADDGTFSDADVYKVRFVRSSDVGGLSIEAIARAIRERRFSLAFMDGTHYRWAALRTASTTAVPSILQPALPEPQNRGRHSWIQTSSGSLGSGTTWTSGNSRRSP
jgi:hypothetical protein